MQAEDGKRLVLFIWQGESIVKDANTAPVLTFVRDPCGFDDLHGDAVFRLSKAADQGK